MSESVIRLQGVMKKYVSHEVLKGVSLQVNKGDIYGLIGKNGAGKTTIFKMILGLSPMDEGTVSISGSTNEKELLKNRGRIGFFVGTRFFDNLSARDNLDYFGTVKGISGKYRKEETERVLEIVGLKDVRKKYKGFSMGMKQRLGIANALIGNPEILILDEPTNGLDPQGIADVRNMIHRINEEFGITVVVSSHILGELENTATRFGIVHEGLVAKEITREDLKIREDKIEISVDDLERAKEVLAANGIKVLKETQERSTLEEFYFRVIGGV
ncbi:MAG: ATP-binding cassette domain-containing protein [Lachnospiraceae bacterium]|nr:ATP-binding cassette domain-containing protein [Lachnospiraceae bacterium]